MARESKFQNFGICDFNSIFYFWKLALNFRLIHLIKLLTLLCYRNTAKRNKLRKKNVIQVY